MAVKQAVKQNTKKQAMRLPPMPTMNMKKTEIIEVYQNMANLVSRSVMAGTLGQTFGGARDVYEVLGWKKDLYFQDYLEMYDRNGIAARVVDALADESWRLPPVMKDGEIRGDDESGEKITDFLKQWNDMAERLDLWSVFNDLDTALGISRYAVILIGVRGEKKKEKAVSRKGNPKEQSATAGGLDTPLEQAATVEYLQVYDEGQAQIQTWDRNVNSARYGLPVLYNITFEDGGKSVPVHYTRVIHCKEGRGRSRVYGIPRLKKSYNYLSDLEKVVGSSSEAFWLLIRKGLVLSATEGKNFPAAGTADYKAMQDEIQEWEHQLRRVMRVKGVEVTDLGSDVVDGRQQHDLLITDIAGTNGMPQRVLVGSERGELASTQDDSNWASVVNSRQGQVCSRWVKDTARRFIAIGALPKPTGRMGLEWPELFKLTLLDETTIATNVATAIDKITGGVPEQAMRIEDFMKKYLKYVLPSNAPKQTTVSGYDETTSADLSINPTGDGGGMFSEQVSQLIQQSMVRNNADLKEVVREVVSDVLNEFVRRADG